MSNTTVIIPAYLDGNGKQLLCSWQNVVMLSSEDELGYFNIII